MPTEVWEYTPSGGDWWNRYPEAEPVTPNYTQSPKSPVRKADLALFAVVVFAALGFAHQYRAQREHVATAATPAKFASFYNCQLPQPGMQPQQRDGDPNHTQFFPYNYTVCDGVQVTLWTAVR